jgi:hypothetical protein
MYNVHAVRQGQTVWIHCTYTCTCTCTCTRICTRLYDETAVVKLFGQVVAAPGVAGFLGV